MAEETTTEAPITDGGSQTIQGVVTDDQGRAIAESQPEVTEQAEAVAPETTETPEVTETAPEPAEAADNSQDATNEWLKKKGIDPTSPEAVAKVAEMARNAEKAMHEKAQKASELEKATKITDEQLPDDVTTSGRENVRMRNLELKFDIQEWKRTNPDKLEHEAEMVKVLQDPNKRLLVQEGYLSLDDVHSIAVASSPTTLQEVKSQGKKEALQTLAQKQKAAVPTGNAVNPSGTGSNTAITPQNVDAMVSKMSPDEYRRRLPEINAALAG